MDIGNGRVVIEWEGGRTVVEAPDQVRIGRDEAMDITIADPMVSREHARVLWDDGWYVTDAGSKNGTFVDGHRVDRLAVTDSVVVHCGGPYSAPSLRIIVADPSATRTRKGMIGQLRTMRADDMRPAPRRKRRPLETGARSIGRDRTCDARLAPAVGAT